MPRRLATMEGFLAAVGPATTTLGVLVQSAREYARPSVGLRWEDTRLAFEDRSSREQIARLPDAED
jgi:hypothetical protein